MKRLLLILCLFLSLLVQGQRSIIHTDQVTVGHWSDSREDWDWEKPKYTIINFILQNNTLLADDVAESTYKVFDKIVDTEELAMWDALDETNTSCNIIINYVDPGTISVMYEYIIYVYEVSYVE